MADKLKREKEKSQPIRVFIRARPLTKQEKETRSVSCIEMLGPKELSVKFQYGKQYVFDKVFGPAITQLDIYKTVVKPLIPDILTGYNCTVFAYGQTGTGKTHTMAGGSVFTVGSSWQEDEEAGIIPRAMAHLFDELYSSLQQYTVRVSYLELYNEELYDLLGDTVDGKGIKLYEDQNQKGSVLINGITKETVCNKREVYKILQRGQEKRKTASTLMNTQSSRSHTVFSIMVHTYETTVEGEQLVKTGKLNLVDLAGSENISKSGAVDMRAREAGNINQSLLTLGRVIKALVEKSGHIPYRESKLTRILQDSLGGRTKTSIIATISPATACLDETLSTLEYANRARNIKNRPEVNQRMSQKTWKLQYDKEMDQLRKDLHAARTGTGIYLDQENYDQIVADSDNYREELAAQITTVNNLEQRMKTMEEEKEMITVEWTQLNLSFETMKKELEQTAVAKAEQEYLAHCSMGKAATLYEQAQLLLNKSKSNASNFHKKIDNLRAINQGNNDSVNQVTRRVVEKFDKIAEELIAFMITLKDSNEFVANTITGNQKEQVGNYKMTELSSHKVVKEAQSMVSVICEDIHRAHNDDNKESTVFFNIIESQLQDIQNMTTWVDIKLELAKINAEMASDVNKADECLKEQETCADNATDDIQKIRDKVHDTMMVLQGVCNGLQDDVLDRLHALEGRVFTIAKLNQECSTAVTSIKTIAECQLPAACVHYEEVVNNSSNQLSRTLNIIENTKSQGLGVNQFEVIQHLNNAMQNIKQLDNGDISKPVHLVETHYQNLQRITKTELEQADNMLAKFSDKNNKMLDQLLKSTEVASQSKESISADLNECRNILLNITNHGLIYSLPTGDTPSRTQSDRFVLAQLTPKDKMISRFREQSKELNEHLNDPEANHSSIATKIPCFHNNLQTQSTQDNNSDTSSSQMN